MKTMRPLGISLLVILLLIIQACTPAANQTGEPAPELETLQVGYIPTMGYSTIFIALDKGYFAEEGLDVQLQSFNSGAHMIAPLSTGQLDVGSGEVGTALFNASHQGLDVKAVSAFTSMPPGHGANPILVRKDLYDTGEITEPADLKGKKIAVNVERGISEYLVAEALAKGGLTVDDVELIAIPFPDMPAAFANQAIDAANASFPPAARILEDGSAVVLVKGDEITDNPQITVVYIGQRLLDPANRDLAVRYLKAYLKAAREMDSENWMTDENLAIINKYTEIPVPLIKASIIPYFEPNGKINMESVAKIQDYMVKRGYTEYESPIDLNSVIDTSFIQEAVNQLGEFKP